MEIIFDLETLPGALSHIDEIRQELAQEPVKAPSSIKKDELIEALGGEIELKKLKVDELKQMYAEELKPEIIEQKLRKRSLDPEQGNICAFGYYIGDDLECLTTENASEKEMLKFVVNDMEEKLKRKDSGFFDTYFVAHNAPFDLGFFYKRCVIHNINPGFKIPFGQYPGKAYWCTMQAWTGDRNKFVKLNHICELLDIPLKPDGMEGSKVFDYALEGKWDEIREYCKHDVSVTREVYDRQRFFERDSFEDELFL